MGKQLKFEYTDGKIYTLEFNRKTVKDMEAEGFTINDVQDKMMTRLPQLFAGAFKMHHPALKRPVINEIYRMMPDKVELFACLSEMYGEPYETLLSEPDGEEKNAIKWKPNWERKTVEEA